MLKDFDYKDHKVKTQRSEEFELMHDRKIMVEETYAMKFNVADAQEKFESLMAMAFNGEVVLIADGENVVKLEPLPESVVPGKVWTAEDFSDWN